jgi:hypothetical protein
MIQKTFILHRLQRIRTDLSISMVCATIVTPSTPAGHRA